MSHRLIHRISQLLVLFALLAPPALADPIGTTTGTFNTPDSGPGEISLSAQSPMTPQTPSWVRVQVTDLDGMVDVSIIQVRLYYGVTDEATLTWTREGSPEWDLAADATWSIEVGLVPDDDDTSGTWEFRFHPGKAAPQGANWQMEASVTSGVITVQVSYAGSIVMNWYGEIAVNTAPVNWGSVQPGSDFQSNKVTGISVKYISNGNFVGQIKSSSPWQGGATLDPSGNCSLASQFALKANWLDSYNPPNRAELVGTTGTTFYEPGAGDLPTGEGGLEVNSNTLWLKLADQFAKGQHDGTITYIIASN